MTLTMKILSQKSVSAKVFAATVTTLSLLLAATAGCLLTTRHKLSEASHTLASIPLCDDGRKQTVFPLSEAAYQARFLDDSTIVYISDRSLHLWHYLSGKDVVAIQGHTGHIHDYEISPNRSQIATASADGTIRIWDANTTRCLAVSQPLDTLDQPGWTMLHDIVYHPSGKRIMSADMCGKKVWRAADLKLMKGYESDLFYLRNGLLSPGWETACVPIIPPEGNQGFKIYHKNDCLFTHTGSDIAWCYSPDGKRLLTVKDDGTMYIWDVSPSVLRKHRSMTFMNGPEIPVTAAAFSPDGTQLASAHTDGTVRIWNAHNGVQREVLHWEGRHIGSLSFNPTGSRILAVSNDSCEVCIWGPFHWVI